MTFKELALKRESCRNYLEAPVAHEDLVDIVKTAIYAPSASNRQSWRFFICEGETAKRSPRFARRCRTTTPGRTNAPRSS